MRTAGVEPSSVIRTSRLELRPCRYEMARASLDDLEELVPLVGARIARGWPSEDLREAIPVYMAHLERDPAALGWGLWLMIEPVAKLMVGDAGFKGRPDALRRVEIGYGVAPDERGKGYATEAASALVEWAGARGVGAVVAECLDDNVASVRVLEKAGFRRTGTIGPMLRWERRMRP